MRFDSDAVQAASSQSVERLLLVRDDCFVSESTFFHAQAGCSSFRFHMTPLNTRCVLQAQLERNKCPNSRESRCQLSSYTRQNLWLVAGGGFPPSQLPSFPSVSERYKLLDIHFSNDLRALKILKILCHAA